MWERTFQYEIMWETHPKLKPFLQAQWQATGESDTVDDLKGKLTMMSGDLSQWDRLVFGNVRQEIRHLKQNCKSCSSFRGVWDLATMSIK